VSGLGAVDPRVGEVEQRLPVVRATRQTCLGGIVGEEVAGGVDVADRRGGVDAGGGHLAVLGEKLACLLPAVLAVDRGVVGQAGETKELVDPSSCVRA
jgi:hypothetical protein